MLRLYHIAQWPLRLIEPLVAAARSRDAAGRREWDERRARRLPEAASGGLWLHGASVGESALVGLVAAELRRRRPDRTLAVSALTPGGRGRLPAPPLVDAAFFVPLDFPGRATRVLERLRPAALALFETELWPNLLTEARAADVPVLVLNARLSPRRMRRYRRLAGLYGPLVAGLAGVGAQSEADAERYLELGAASERVVVTGNLKYDLPAPTAAPAEVRRRLGVTDKRQVIVAGSTAEGEDELVLDAVARLGPRRPFLVLAPRHVKRVDAVLRLTVARGLRVARLSGLAAGAGADGPIDGILVDTLGDLATLYAAADVAFVGGSLVPVGGHNLLEPAGAGVPVLFGPHVDHVADMAADLAREGGGRVVADVTELSTALAGLLDDPSARADAGRAARTLVERNRGALSRTVDLVDAVARPAARSPAVGAS